MPPATPHPTATPRPPRPPPLGRAQSRRSGEPGPASVHRRDGASVLLVDDDNDMVMAMQDVLALRMPHVAAVGSLSGTAALAMMRAQPIGALVTDLRMPGMSGFELADAARQVQPGLPVVMVTASPLPSVTAKAAVHSLNALLTKPFNLDTFVEAVQSALAVPPASPHSRPDYTAASDNR